MVLVDRLDVKVGCYAGGYLNLEAATALTGFVGGFTALCKLDAAGYGRERGLPGISRLIVETSGKKKRGLCQFTDRRGNEGRPL